MSVRAWPLFSGIYSIYIYTQKKPGYMSQMPDLLLKNVKPVTAAEAADSVIDIRIENGIIVETGTGLAEKEGQALHDAGGAWVRPGWMDMHVHFREPGQDHKETIRTGCEAAAFGGFTEVASMPNTNPPI